MSDIYNIDKCKKMLETINKTHKEVEEHCNYQIIVREIFRRIEKEFDTNCLQFHSKNGIDWDDFKEKLLKEK